MVAEIYRFTGARLDLPDQRFIIILKGDRRCIFFVFISKADIPAVFALADVAIPDYSNHFHQSSKISPYIPYPYPHGEAKHVCLIALENLGKPAITASSYGPMGLACVRKHWLLHSQTGGWRLDLTAPSQHSRFIYWVCADERTRLISTQRYGHLGMHVFVGKKMAGASIRNSEVIWMTVTHTLKLHDLTNLGGEANKMENRRHTLGSIYNLDTQWLLSGHKEETTSAQFPLYMSGSRLVFFLSQSSPIDISVNFRSLQISQVVTSRRLCPTNQSTYTTIKSAFIILLFYISFLGFHLASAASQGSCSPNLRLSILIPHIFSYSRNSFFFRRNSRGHTCQCHISRISPLASDQEVICEIEKKRRPP